MNIIRLRVCDRPLPTSGPDSFPGERLSFRLAFARVPRVRRNIRLYWHTLQTATRTSLLGERRNRDRKSMFVLFNRPMAN